MQVQGTKTQRPTADTTTTPVEALDFTDRIPNGEAMAALLSAGIGVFLLGLLTTLVEASADIKTFLTFNKGVGPLSGKTIIPVVAWLVVWAGLHLALKGKNVNFLGYVSGAIVLMALGVLGTFPLFFQMFGG